MAYRFVHAADLHLDTPFAGIGAAHPAVAAALRDASLAAWDALVALTLQEEALFLLLAGDLYDGADRGIRAQLRVLAGLERLARAGVQVFMVHGNHDPLEGWTAIRRWPQGVAVFPAGAVTALPVARDGRHLATVYGVSYAHREEQRNLARLFGRREGPGLHVGLLHCNVGSDPDYGPYAPCSLADLAAAGMDYWALGHVHRRRLVARGRPWAAYPGCLQGRSPAPGELGAKGALVVEWDPELGVVAEPRFVPLDQVRWERLAVDVAGAADLAGVFALAQQWLAGLRAAAPGRALLVRLELVGRTVLAAEIRRADARGELLGELRALEAEVTPLVWLESLALRVQAPLDRDEVRRGGDFAAELVLQADGLRADPAALARLLALVEGELRTPARERLLPPPAGGAAAADLLAAAEERCLALLLEGDGP